MKKKNYSKVLCILAAASFLIASIEGFLYYAEYADFGLFRLVLTLQNSFKAFLFDPNLSAEDVLGTLTGTVSTFELYIGLAYVAAAFIAPLCTATALFVAAESFFRTRLRDWRIRRQEGILIFGYNENVKMLLKNQGEEHGNAPIIHLIADVELPQKEELALMKQNIFFRQMDCVYASKESMRRLFSDIHVEKIQKIFLLEDADMKNVSLYLRLCELTGEKFSFAEGAVCCCRCAESYARELIADYFDIARPKLGLYLFDLAELWVRKAFDRHPIWGNRFDGAPAPDPAMPPERFDARILIAGFGHVGEQVLRQAVNMSVAHSQSNILIDVVDQEASTKKARFFSSLQLDDAFVSDNELRIGGDTNTLADGILTIRFHDMDAREDSFTRFLRAAAAQRPFTYAAVCIKDLEVGIRAVSAIERSITAGRPFPIAVRIKGSEQLAEYLDKNDTTFGNVFAMGGATPDDVLRLEDIYHGETEKAAREYHEIYRRLHFAPAGTEGKPGAPWDVLKLYQQQANRLLSYHTATKDYMLRSIDGREAGEVLKEHLTAAGITVEGERFTYNFPESELLSHIEGDPVLLELMRTEHRRWCYAMLLSGWRSCCTEKNEARRESPYICTWETLDEGVRKYDLLPALMMSRQSTPT